MLKRWMRRTGQQGTFERSKPFMMRSADRDRRTDLERWERLSIAANRMDGELEQLIKEIEGERNGLEARHRKYVEDAAFSLQAFENDDGNHLSLKADQMAGAMKQLSARLNHLALQAVVIADARRRVQEQMQQAIGQLNGSAVASFDTDRN